MGIYAVFKSNMKSDKQARLLGRTRREYLIPHPRETVKEQLLQFIEASSELEKGWRNFTGFEIRSTKRNFFSPLFVDLRIFTCTCGLYKEGDETRIKMDVGYYAHQEAVMVIVAIMFFLFLLLLILDNIYHFATRRGDKIELLLVLGFFSVGIGMYKNYRRKQKGLVSIEALVNQLKNRLAELEL